MACIQKKKEKEDDKKDNRTIIAIPDELWDEIKVNFTQRETTQNSGSANCTIQKGTMELLYILRTGCQWKMLPKEYESGSTCHRRFQEWNKLDVFKKTWVRLLKIYFDQIIGINWTWQSIDSISIKSPLGGR